MSPLSFLHHRRHPVVVDLPQRQARRIAEIVVIEPPNGMVRGKGTRVDDLAPVLDLVRPRKLVCRCGKPATIQIQSFVRGAKPVDLCDDCPEPRAFKVVDGGDIA